MSCRKVLYEDSDGGKLETIDVYLRVKPSKCEDQAAVWKISDDKYVSITCPASSRALKRKLGKHEENRFLFTHIFGPEVQQQQLFEKCIEAPLIDFIGGHNTLVFSYGTSNCGKTYTIQGTRHHPGIIPRVLHLVFNTLGEHLMPSEDLKYMPYMNGVIDICDQSRRQLHEHKRTLTEQPIDEIDLMGTDIPEIERAFNQMEEQLDGEMRQVHAVPCNRKCSLWISYIEIYNEALFDLLRPLHPPRKQLKLAEDSSKAYYVKDLSYVHVATAAEAYKVLMFGKKNLQTATTHQNKRSSRSHCIFTLCLLQTADDGQMSVSRLSICDLAGVERQKNTHNMGDRLKESQHINCSLHVLRRCFDRMRDNQSRADKLVVPYRESKLTKLFQKSLSGDGKVIMLVNVNPETNFEELLNVMKASAIARKVIISDTTINTPSSMRKHRRSVLFTASLAEHNNTHSLVENCDVLEEETEPTFLNAAGDDDETPMKKSKIMIPSTSSASRVHPKHTITSDNKNSTENLLRKEVHTLKATIERLKEQNKSMSAEVTELKAIKMKGMDVEKHNQQVDDLLDEMDEMRKTMQKKIDDKVSVLREAFTEIQYYEKDITELSRRNEKLERDLLVKETKLDELNKQISVNDTVLAAKTDKNEELEAMVDGLQEDVEQLMMMVETKDTQLKEAHDSMRADKIAFDKKCADLEKLSTELDALKSLYSEKLQENIQLKGDLRKEKEREFKLEKDNKDKVDQAESFEREISTYNARCKGLTEKVEQLEKKLVNSEILYKTIIESKDQEVKVLEKRILDNENVYKITIGAKDREIKELEKKIIDNENLYKITIGSKDKEIKELEKKILENENLHKLTIESKNREIKDLGSLLQGKKSTNEELKSGSEELQRRYAALLKKLDEELRAKDEQIAEMKRNLDMCMLEKDLLEKECEHSRVYTRELEMKKSTQFWTNVEDLEELRKEKKALETSYEELEKSLEEESSHTSILLSQIENEKARTGEMQVSLVNMRRRNARLKRLLDKTREETNARELYLERQLEKKREELREEKDKVESFKNANEELKMGLIKCEEKFIEYEKKIETLLDNNEKSSSTTSSLTYYKNEIKHLKYELSKCEEKFLKAQKTLENTVDKFQLTEKLLKKNLEEKEQEISTFKQYHIGEVETLNNEIKKLKRSLVEEKVMVEAHSLKEKTDETIKKHLAEYQKEIVQFSKDTDKFEEKVLLIENLKQSIDKKEAELKEATACLSQHQQENNNLKNEIAQLKEKFDQYVGVMEEDITRDSKIKDLTERVNQYRNEIYDLKSQQMNIECHNCGLAIKHLNK